MNGWTPERKARQAALIRQWQPWSKSTGAKTPEGKEAVSKNAVKHGLRGKALAQSLKELRRAMREQKRMVTRL